MTKKPASRPPTRGRPRSRKPYTAGEWFMVAIGVALVILVIGMVVSSVLE